MPRRSAAKAAAIAAAKLDKEAKLGEMDRREVARLAELDSAEDKAKAAALAGRSAGAGAEIRRGPSTLPASMRGARFDASEAPKAKRFSKKSTSPLATERSAEEIFRETWLDGLCDKDSDGKLTFVTVEGENVEPTDVTNAQIKARLSQFIDPDDGTLKHYPPSSVMPVANKRLSDRVKRSFKAEFGYAEDILLSRHHNLAKEQTIALWHYMYDTYNAVMHPSSKADAATKEVALDSLVKYIQMSGFLLNPTIRARIGLAKLEVYAAPSGRDASLKHSFLEQINNNDEAVVLVEYLTKPSFEPDPENPAETRKVVLSDDERNTRAEVIAAMQKLMVWWKVNLVVGPAERPYRIDGAASDFDAFSGAAKAAGVSDRSFVALEQLNQLILETHEFVERTDAPSAYLPRKSKPTKKLLEKQNDFLKTAEEQQLKRIAKMHRHIVELHAAVQNEFTFSGSIKEHAIKELTVLTRGHAPAEEVVVSDKSSHEVVNPHFHRVTPPTAFWETVGKDPLRFQKAVATEEKPDGSSGSGRGGPGAD